MDISLTIYKRIKVAYFLSFERSIGNFASVPAIVLDADGDELEGTGGWVGWDMKRESEGFFRGMGYFNNGSARLRLNNTLVLTLTFHSPFPCGLSVSPTHVLSTSHINFLLVVRNRSPYTDGKLHPIFSL